MYGDTGRGSGGLIFEPFAESVREFWVDAEEPEDAALGGDGAVELEFMDGFAEDEREEVGLSEEGDWGTE